MNKLSLTVIILFSIIKAEAQCSPIPFTGNSVTFYPCTSFNVSIPLTTTVSPVTCVWQNVSGLVSGGNTLNPTVNNAGTYSFTLTNTMNGCTTIDSAIVVSNNQPAWAILNISNNSICLGQTTTITAIPTNSTSSLSYSWAPSNGLSSTIDSVVYASPTADIIYTITATNLTSGCISFITTTINVLPNPALNSSYYNICSGSALSLYASGATSYTWIPTSQAGNNVIVQPTTNTTYTVFGSTGACTGSATANVTVFPLPTLSVSVTNDTICAGETATLTASTSGTVTYIWSTGSSLPAITLSPTVTTSYNVTAADNITGCAQNYSSFITVDTNCSTVGLQENSNIKLTSICPNPTSNLLRIISNISLQKIEVMTLAGQILMSEIPIGNNHVLYLENYANGIYFVNLFQNNRVIKREKIVLNK